MPCAFYPQVHTEVTDCRATPEDSKWPRLQLDQEHFKKCNRKVMLYLLSAFLGSWQS